MFDLDLKDRKILYELDANSRQSASQIAKKVGLSPEVTNYRIKRFEQEQIITHYQLIVNLSALRIYQFKICLALQHLTSLELKPIIDKLVDNEAVKWVVQTKGSWDLLIAVETDDFNNINPLKNKIISLFGSHIREKSVSILVEAQTYNRNFLLEEATNTNRLIMKRTNLVSIDELDKKILLELSKNARLPLLELSKKVNQSTRTIHYRLKQLEKKKIILGYKVAINYAKLGIKFYKTFIYLDNPKQERINLFKATLANHKNITHNVEVISNWDLEPEFETQSEEEFNQHLEQIKNEFSDIIKQVDVLTIIKEYKFVYF